MTSKNKEKKENARKTREQGEQGDDKNKGMQSDKTTRECTANTLALCGIKFTLQIIWTGSSKESGVCCPRKEVVAQSTDGFSPKFRFHALDCWNIGYAHLLSKNLKVGIYETVILPVVLYGCETWTLTLREGQKLRVFENKVLRKIFGAKRDEVTGEWRKLHNAELHALYSSPGIVRNTKSRRLKWAGHVTRMGKTRNAYGVLVGRPEGRRILSGCGNLREDNIEIDLREVGYDGREWINLAQDRDQWRAHVMAAMNLRVLHKSCVIRRKIHVSAHTMPYSTQSTSLVYTGQQKILLSTKRFLCHLYPPPDFLVGAHIGTYIGFFPISDNEFE
ncbi:hypothetical protein ANN_24571 [Periplaneta americana]|uniref:Uncharacterized protein n=1 Tax=Periplaneta americana TaxID=6978 RepID=A0ABQ8S3Q6_PERAM|nr:hypothetical protein ANN_24571 [Periplaneta americana]